ncbi:MAG: FecR domain-containing protein [Candidatus Coatesbacteria bacterium]
MTFRWLLLSLVTFAYPGVSLAGTDGRVFLATIDTVTRLVRVQDAEGAAIRPAEAGATLVEGARVFTLKDAKCRINFGDGRILSLAGDSSIVIARMPKKGAMRWLVKLISGRVRAKVDRMRGETDFGVYASTTVTAVKGTGWDVVKLPDGLVQVLVDDGKVNVAEIKDEKDLDQVEKIFLSAILGNVGLQLAAGKMMSIMPGKPFPSPVPIPPGFPNPFDDWGKTPGTKSPSSPTPPGLPGLPGGGGFGFP